MNGIFNEKWWVTEERELKSKKKKANILPRTLIPVPDTGWTCPSDFPDLSAAKALAIDVETRDEGLNDGQGPGTRRKDSYLAGIAVGTDDGHHWYFPMRHETGPNLDPDKVKAWANDQLNRKNQPKIGANLMYDLEWLAVEGVTVEGPFYDVQYAEPLLDEYALSYSLETLAQKYTGGGKDDTLMYQWLSSVFGGNPTRKSQAGRIWRASSTLAGPYAQSDVRLPFEIFREQQKLLKEQGLWDLYKLECGLIPMLLAMRLRGVRVDVSKAEHLQHTLTTRIERDQAQLNKLAGDRIDVWAPEQFSPIFDRHGIPYPKTKKGNPSFQKAWLERHESKIAQLISSVRKWDKLKNTFVDGYILNRAVNGRVHGQFHPLRSDDYGTVSGRFSSSMPNLQNIPARDPELGPLMRGLFIPEDGELWGKFDYAQIEPRLVLHYAGSSANAVRAAYAKDHTLDCYNTMLAEMPDGLTRSFFKSLYLGMTYGMGVPTLARQLNMTEDGVREYFEMFHEGAPYIRDLRDRAQRQVNKVGFIKTLFGRRARFETWENSKWMNEEEKSVICLEKGDPSWFLPEKDRAAAVEKWGQVKRAGQHKVLNRLIQGSAADVMKRAMLDIWESGICDQVGVPMLTVHDELDFSIDGGHKNPVTEKIKEIMQDCVNTKVKLLCDVEFGTNWGNVK
jgi:DNA polymerase I-like protein with 3'-5' exonuclease and polymerase domains